MNSQGPERKAWINMRLRCYNPASRDYPNFGGRGIRVCDAWRDDFDQFFLDMGERPQGEPGYWRLDRINKDGDYEPSNCQWATRDQTERRNSKRLPRGERHVHAKLKPADVQLLRSANLSGREITACAKRLGVTPKALREAIRGKTWKHV